MGTLYPFKDHPAITGEDVEKILSFLLNKWQKEKYIESKQIDISYGLKELGRFRINVFQQRGSPSLVCRHIPSKILSVEELNLPNVVTKISMEQRGLVLVTGTTGSGKSTTLAAMTQHINTNRNCHILTIEDPIEFMHRDHKSLINQREIGFDTDTFVNALRVGLRQDPDVILVGEMRDLETIETAMLAAETGHLVMSTLHTLDAMETINRIIAVFPSHQQAQIRRQLASILRGVISQRLMPRADGRGRVPAVEVLLGTARIRDCIDDPAKTKEIRDVIAKGQTSYGMQTFDQSLMFLLEKKLITYEEALMQCSNPDDFALRVKGIYSTSDAGWGDYEAQQEQEPAEENSEEPQEEDPEIERFEK